MTTANQKPEIEQVNNALKRLEHRITSLAAMSSILSDMLDELIVDFDTQAIAGPMITVRLRDDDTDKLSFAWNDVSSRAQELRDAFYDAIKGESTN